MRRVTPLWSATDHTCARAGARHVVVGRLAEPQWPLPGSVSEPAGKKQCRARGAGRVRSPAAPGQGPGLHGPSPSARSPAPRGFLVNVRPSAFPVVFSLCLSMLRYI